MTKTAESEIRTLLAAYAAGFDDADPEAVTALFAWPATIWQLGKGNVFEDADALQENVDALIDVFDEAGIVSMRPEIETLHVAGEAAFASVLWQQHDDKSELLHEFSCQYLLVNRDGAWKIATIVNEDAEE